MYETYCSCSGAPRWSSRLTRWIVAGVACCPPARLRVGFGRTMKNMTNTSVATSQRANNACASRIRKKRR